MMDINIHNHLYLIYASHHAKIVPKLPWSIMDSTQISIMISLGFNQTVMKSLFRNNTVEEKIWLSLKVTWNRMVKINHEISFIQYYYLEKFQFFSRRHPDYPFALAFYVNGLIVNRVSVCCESKHKHNVPLGGKNGFFGIVDVKQVEPCRRFVIFIHEAVYTNYLLF